MNTGHAHENHTGHAGHDGHTSQMDHDAHDPHGSQEGHGEHTGHDGHDGHAGHGDHVAQFRRLFWIMLIIAIPVIAFSPMFGHLVGYEIPETGILGWLRCLSPILGTVMYFSGRQAVPNRWAQRAEGSQPGHDAAHCSGHHPVRIPLLLGFLPRTPRCPTRLLVGAGTPRRHHARRALAGNAVPGTDHLGTWTELAALLPDRQRRSSTVKL